MLSVFLCTYLQFGTSSSHECLIHVPESDMYSIAKDTFLIHKLICADKYACIFMCALNIVHEVALKHPVRAETTDF